MILLFLLHVLVVVLVVSALMPRPPVILLVLVVSSDSSLVCAYACQREFTAWSLSAPCTTPVYSKHIYTSRLRVENHAKTLKEVSRVISCTSPNVKCPI